MTARAHSGTRGRLLSATTAAVAFLVVSGAGPVAAAEAPSPSLLPPAGIDSWFDEPDTVQELPPLSPSEPTEGVDADPEVTGESVTAPPTTEETGGEGVIPWVPGFAIAGAVGLLVAGVLGLVVVTRRPGATDYDRRV